MVPTQTVTRHPTSRKSPTIVLLPGLDGTGVAFTEFRAALRDVETCVIRYPTEASGYAFLERHVRACLPADRPILLVGESYGGPLVVSVAASPPPNLVGAALCATFLRCPRPTLRPFRALLRILPARRLPGRLLAPLLLGRFATPRHVETIDSTLAAASPDAMLRRLLDVASVDVTAQARRVEVPSLYLRGSRDRLVPAGAAALVRSFMPAAQLVEIDAPHLLLQVAAQSAAGEMRRFACRQPG